MVDLKTAYQAASKDSAEYNRCNLTKNGVKILSLGSKIGRIYRRILNIRLRLEGSFTPQTQ